MNPKFLHAAILGWVVSVVSSNARAGGELVVFPNDYAKGIHYATVNRGNIREELFASQAAIEAVKKGKPIPNGTVVTLVDYRDGKLFRYVVMEKKPDEGATSPPICAMATGSIRHSMPTSPSIVQKP